MYTVASGCLQCDSILRGEYACATPGCDGFAGNELCLPRASTFIYSVYLVYLKTVQPSRECYCICIACGYLLIAYSEESSRDYRIHPNFRGAQFSRIAISKHFAETIFTDQAFRVYGILKFCQLNFRELLKSVKTKKITRFEI